MKFSREKWMLPAFPRTPHLPHLPNTDKTDCVASAEEAAVIFTAQVWIEEKIDGASVGMSTMDGEPLVRNRDHILRKGYSKKTAAKQQFASIWNWWYENREKFAVLADAGPYSIYGEWCVAQHGIAYNRLPDWFIPYDLYQYEKDFFLPPPRAREILTAAGFSCFPAHFQLDLDNYEGLAQIANGSAEWADSLTEGVYLKVYDEERITHRFKMVRPDFVRGALWNPKEMTKNKLAEKFPISGRTSPTSSPAMSG